MEFLDVEFVKAVLTDSYKMHRDHEIPYPSLDETINLIEFDYDLGTVEGETPNGSKSREGNDYYWFQHAGKSILTHRFIAAVTLGKWAPREFDIDHVNHNPSDNRPHNLRIVTRRDNAGNRRKVLLSELTDLQAISVSELERKQSKDRLQEDDLEPEIDMSKDNSNLFSDSSIPHISFTGETKPANNGGTWHMTNLGSWHLRFD
ncbi:HNH endonuclease [Octadecabacter sp. CECT 8868]|uniref:HNH endonuclease signature motif containing protein n=1 Tax=Octadecabacter algicola TaxID=2909342 RepID=UPI001F47A438|nr:HNH endonuclease signature motif containing protein [Octadecabacter algicola]MCF2904647.1 HNH endonuclease [Octadecabacter algicola]